MKRRARVRGLVALANAVRRAWVDADRQDAVVRDLLARLTPLHEQMLADRLRPADLPGPSRRAWRFLTTLVHQHSGHTIGRPAGSKATPAIAAKELPRSVAGAGVLTPPRVPGLRRRTIHVLDEIGLMVARRGESTAYRDDLKLIFKQLEVHVRHRGIDPADLTEVSQRWLGYLRFLSDGRHFARMVHSLELAYPHVSQAVLSQDRTISPCVVRFVPCNSLYRWRVRPGRPALRQGGCTLLDLPTGMLCFDEADFELVARRIAGQPSARSSLQERLQRPDYRAMLRLTCGEPVEADPQAEMALARGAFHDLDESFRRVNAEYFGNQMDLPRLRWSRSMAGRQFGHYDPVSDTVVLSTSMDRADVPAYVIDHVMYHELLHKQLGGTVTPCTLRFHTSEFRRAEARYSRFAEAEEWLRRLTLGG